MPEKSYQEIWNNCLNVIRDNVTAQNFKTWFKPIKAIAINKQVLTIHDDKRIYAHVLSFGGEAVMTSKAHKNGTW